MWLLDGHVFPGARALNLLFTSCYYLLNCYIPFLWLAYTAAYYNETELFFRKLRVFTYAPLVLNLLNVVMNVFAGALFTIDAQNHYHRGLLFPPTAVMFFLYLIVSAVLAWRKTKLAKTEFERRRCTAIARFLILPSLGGLLQSVFYGTSLLWICVTLSCLMIYINVQNTQISTDALTGLNNRYQFDKHLIRMFSSEETRADTALIMIDVNKFKQINDTYGHIFGDRVLIAVADALKRSCGSCNAFLSRYGGDEFTIVCRPALVDTLMEAVLSNLSSFNASGTLGVTLSVSMGCAQLTEEGIHTVDELIALADSRMYEQKRAKA